MSITKCIPLHNVDHSEVAPVITAIRKLKQELEHEVENLTADCRAVARTEWLIVGHQLSASSSSDRRNSDIAVASSRDSTTGRSVVTNGLRSSICGVAEGLAPTFTAAEVLGQLERQGFKFTGNPAAAVRDALYVLCRGKRPRFRIHEAGKGGRQNIYEQNE